MFPLRKIVEIGFKDFIESHYYRPKLMSLTQVKLSFVTFKNGDFYCKILKLDAIPSIKIIDI